MKRRLLLSIGLGLAPALGCGGNSTLTAQSADSGAPVVDAALRSAPDGVFVVQVEPTKPFSGLTPAENQKICAATEDFGRALAGQQKIQDLGCRIGGLIAFASSPDAMNKPDMAKATCKMAYDACKAAAATPPDAGVAGACPMPDPRCMATVAEYEACLNALPGDLMLLDRLVVSCDKATVLSVAALASVPQLLSPQCQEFNRKCPNGLGALSPMAALPGRP